ncbi:MAG: transcriptional regulator [Cellulomonas sp. 73-145]|uniref:helix-turn-helix transcriptional regulator n=1 Tax=Cellulomonas sp. 73-145 TaxID=1895739 RepID=UPI00092AFF57|nr:helix-turn-helix transcriptional regulator [Cellulomonas sp. 73-145]MBN9326875.1 helix-turn-helix domain-containing protein [Cellulomonas sp.]OJV56719.1 MAG: transcriptional regulator [Cellulomonas sp. 73-145]
MDNRDEIRDFLASRRARLNPTDVGLPAATGRRRVVGLRRDEVAVLAGVSSEYYARLERGHLAGASDSVLDAVATALRLDEAEQLHLRNLAQAANQPAARRRSAVKVTGVPASLRRVLDSMVTSPAYVRDSHMDIVAANALGKALHAPVYRYAQATSTPPNTARFAFLDPAGQDFYPDWGQVGRDCVAALHAAAGRNPYDKPLTDLIGELSTRSEAFRSLWATHDVRLHRTGVKRLRHPEVGILELDYDVMEVIQQPGLLLIAYSAEPGTPAADGLALLASLAATADLTASSS